MARIRVLTQNTWFLRPALIDQRPRPRNDTIDPDRPIPFVPVPDRHAAQRARAEALLAALRQRDTAPDVICFQEVFEEPRRDQLEKAFVGAGYQVDPKHSAGAIEDSGLFFASRLPVLPGSIGFHAFRSKGTYLSVEHHSDKGVSCAGLDIGGGRRLWVFNTHTNAEERPVRLGQLREIRAFVERLLARQGAGEDDAVLLCGDLNVPEQATWSDSFVSSGEHAEMGEALGRPRDLFREMHPKAASKPGYTWDADLNHSIDASWRNPRRPKGQRRQRLDYVLTYDWVPVLGHDRPSPQLAPVTCVKAEVQMFQTTKDTRLSDHFGVDVTIDV